ncbi:MAG: hypothetical protein ACLUNQ_09765 [Oscillospiraceae bacterium]
MIRVDLSHMRHFIPLPYEAALTPGCIWLTSGCAAAQGPGANSPAG